MNSLKQWTSWGQAIQDSFSVAGVLAVFATLAGALIRDIPRYGSWIMGVLFAVLTLSFIVSAAKNRTPTELSWRAPMSPAKGVTITLRRGDLFMNNHEKARLAVVTTNRRFGVTTPDVSETSLISQLGRKINLAELRKNGVLDRSKNQSLGATFSITGHGRTTYLLIATSTPNQKGSNPWVTIDDIWQVYMELWKHVWESEEVIVELPVIGSGNSKSAVDRSALLAVLLISLWAYQQENITTTARAINVIVSEADYTRELVQFVANTTKGMGFERVK